MKGLKDIKTDSRQEYSLAGLSMDKNRLISFNDAILAIIMTILVLGLKVPDSPTLDAFWQMRFDYFAYAFSFFWLGELWITQSSVFRNVKIINNRIVMRSLILLFFCSMVPYFTLLASEYFYSRLIHAAFGAVMLLVNLSALWIFTEISRADPDNFLLTCYIRKMNRILIQSLFLKLIGIILTLTIWPPATILIVAIGFIQVMVSKYRTDRKISCCLQEEDHHPSGDDSKQNQEQTENSTE